MHLGGTAQPPSSQVECWFFPGVAIFLPWPTSGFGSLCSKMTHICSALGHMHLWGSKRVVQAKIGDIANAVDELRQMRARRRLAQLAGKFMEICRFQFYDAEAKSISDLETTWNWFKLLYCWKEICTSRNGFLMSDWSCHCLLHCLPHEEGGFCSPRGNSWTLTPSSATMALRRRTWHLPTLGWVMPIYFAASYILKDWCFTQSTSSKDGLLQSLAVVQLQIRTTADNCDDWRVFD